MTLKDAVMLALQLSILSTVIGFGLQATVTDLLYVLRRPVLFLRSFLAVLVLMPLTALALVRALDLRQPVEITLVALSMSPVPPLLPRKETKGGGNRAYGLGLMVWMAVLSIVAVPATLKLLEYLAGRPLAVSPMEIAGLVLKTVLMPLGAGVVFRVLMPSTAERASHVAALIGKILLPPAAVAVLVGAFPTLLPLVGEGTLLAMVAFVVAGLAIGHVLGRPDPGHALVLALSTASRHPAIALVIASSNYPDLHFAGPLILYLLVNAAVAFPYITWHRRHAVVEARSA